MPSLRQRLTGWLLKDVMQPGNKLISGYAQTGAGVPISEDNAMRYAAVQACVRVLSEDIAALPLHVYRRTETGGKERATDHRLYKILHSCPNPEMTSVSFREAMMVNILLTGNAYAFVEYDVSGRVRALWPIVSTMVQPYRDSARVIRYDVNGETLDASEILHIPGLGYDGLVGLSPIAYARESVGLGVAAEQFGSAFFKNGTHLGGVISVPGKLDDEAFERTSQEFKAMYKGLQNAHGIPLLEGGATFQAVGIAPEDAQFLETRKYQRSEIAGIFRVPPHLIGDLEHATFSNIEHQDISYLQRSLLPWLQRIEQGMTNKLLAENERDKYIIEHDTGGFMRGDTKSRYEAYAIGINNGILTRNEARIRENLNPIEGGDELLQPLNMTTVGEKNTESEPDGGKRGFKLADVSDFTSDRKRRAVIGKKSAAKALGLKESQIRALEKAFSAWLEKQAEAIRQIITDVFGTRSKADDFESAVNAYYDGLMSEALPKDVRKAIKSATDTTLERVRKDLGSEADVIDADWIDGYMTRYYDETRERLLMANKAAIQKAIKGATQDDVDKLTKKLAMWGKDRAANMAKIEAAMAANEALVAAYRKAGYVSVWDSAPGCCKICTAMDGDTVTTLKPPLHKGCICSVRRGEKIN